MKKFLETIFTTKSRHKLVTKIIYVTKEDFYKTWKTPVPLLFCINFFVYILLIVKVQTLSLLYRTGIQNVSLWKFLNGFLRAKYLKQFLSVVLGFESRF